MGASRALASQIPCSGDTYFDGPLPLGFIDGCEVSFKFSKQCAPFAEIVLTFVLRRYAIARLTKTVAHGLLILEARTRRVMRDKTHHLHERKSIEVASTHNWQMYAVERSDWRVGEPSPRDGYAAAELDRNI